MGHAPKGAAVGRNRFRRPRRRYGRRISNALADGLVRLGFALRPHFRAAVLFACVGALGYTAWRAVLASPYFTIRHVKVVPSLHLDRDTILETVGLTVPTNIFRFEPTAAREALLAHPWVAAVRVTETLPDRVTIKIQERKASGIVVLDGLHLVDSEGQPFVRARSDEMGDLPVITVDREVITADVAHWQGRIRDALAVARLYDRVSVQIGRTLSNVHLAPGGRLELMLGSTRVTLGRGRYEQKLNLLTRTFTRMAERKVDAEYILLGDDQKRVIVKEKPIARPLSTSLTMNSQGASD